MRLRVLFMFAGAVVAAAVTLAAQQPTPSAPAQDEPRDGGRFRSGVELINVTATVSDQSGRFVPGLRAEDFAIYEDGEPQEVAYFSTERVPVSLGLVLDTSGSMAGEKFADARTALDRFVFDLLDERDELFLCRFSDYAVLVQDWTNDRALLSRAMSRITPFGGTAMYDALLEALPLATRGHRQKKAIVVISDGNDTSSVASLRDVQDRFHGSDVLLYAVGIDGEAEQTFNPSPQTGPRRFPRPPAPIQPGGGWRGRFPTFPQFVRPGAGGRQFPGRLGDNRVNALALRDLTDDSGGRTEIVHSARDLNPATASIANELSKQYALGYASTQKKDGRWHSIRVEVRDHSLRVRARRGYVAS